MSTFDDAGSAADRLDAVRAARPVTAADDQWANSRAGDRTLTAILAIGEHERGSRAVRIRLPRPSGPRRPVRRPVVVGAGVAAAAVLALGIAVTLPEDSSRLVAAPPSRSMPARVAPVFTGARPSDMALAGYDTCSTALAGLRSHTVAQVTADGLPVLQPYSPYNLARLGAVPQAATDTAPGLAAAPPAHSATNDQEAGVDEPDTIKNDGRRIVTVSGGVLRVTDVADRSMAGSLDLSAYAGADGAQLLLDGDRVLVILAAGAAYAPSGVFARVASGPTTMLLVDISSATPRLISQLHADGSLLGARLVGGTARVVLRSTPKLALTDPPPHANAAARRDHYRAQVLHAPLSAWLPSYTVTTGSDVLTHEVGCTDLSHPSTYSGLSMLTVYSVGLGTGFGSVGPVSLAADGGAVYATPTSLYLASDEHPGSPKDVTQIHRYDTADPGPPAYLGSGSVPGSVADSYSLSEYDGALRIVTSGGTSFDIDGRSTQRHDLYVLDAATLALRGHVGGLGHGEQLYAVRFLGPLAYVVTFRQVDPLYVLDLRDPDRPRVVGSLTQPGYSSYLHDVGAGRLLGVGQTVNADSEPTGLQVSLFDVDRPAHPTRIDQVVRKGSFSTDLDPHAFLYWPDEHLAMLPVQTPSTRAYDTEGTVLVLRVERDALIPLGTITNPAVRPTGGNGYDDGIERTLVIGDSIWTFSPSGLAATDLTTLHRQAWLPFT